MARRDVQIQKPITKEIWDHFKSREMEIFAAYVYKFDGIWPFRKQSIDSDKGEIKYAEQPLPPYRRDVAHAPRPWTCYERFLRAVTAITRKMEDNPAQNLRFAIAYLEADGTILSGNVILEQEETERSKEIYFQIIGKNGMAWGNEAKLKEYANGYGGEMCRKFGFKECDAPAFTGEEGELTASVSLTSAVPESHMEPGEQLSSDDEEVVALGAQPKKRGRPAKVAL